MMCIVIQSYHDDHLYMNEVNEVRWDRGISQENIKVLSVYWTRVQIMIQIRLYLECSIFIHLLIHGDVIHDQNCRCHAKDISYSIQKNEIANIIKYRIKNMRKERDRKYIN